ncbi:complex I subunit 5 family protein [Streptomyces sp. DASNCL29]|uniref:complex I subunit 5 family protein n=1 Tax=Streptomyces sp. DASNCL29 TaxID=2583819 RepID=UPI00110FF2B2|nr:complex I subunit 5 family protein [Streptomyces sp. DASNCL29]TMU89844.1 NADH dehydrogenase [Streptomyces sp. DASNCL29]
MDTARLLPLVVAVPLLGAAVLVATGRRLPRLVSDIVGCAFAAATAAVALLVLFRAGHPGPGSYPVEWVGGWRRVGIVLVGDPLGAGLAALVSLLVVAVLVYSWRYFEEPPRRHTGSFPALVLVFQAGMCGFALTGDLFNAFVFFELMGAVAYALTGFRVEEPKPLQGALAFGVVNSLGAYVTLLGITLLYARTGELGFAQIGRRLDTEGPDGLVLAAFVLVTTGLLVKAAAVPFHFWLPDAHAVAPTPVCMLLSGVMVELGVYGVARVYWTVFSGPGGLSHPDFTRALLVLGVLTALLGAVMCWQQRHLKRLLAFSTVAHTGLFLIGVAVLTPEGISGTALYVLGHAGVKAALFACAGVLLDRYATVDEHELFGRARELPAVGVLFAVAGLGLCGLPPFGSGLGKAAAEEAAGHTAGWLPALYVLVSAVTGGAVLRAGLRIFAGVGRRPREEEEGGPETTGEEEPETGGRLLRIPVPLLAVPAALLAASLALGVIPAVGFAVGRAGALFTDTGGYRRTVLDGHTAAAPAHLPPHWQLTGILLGLLSTALAITLATLAVRRPVHAGTAALLAPVRRLQSGHIGDYVAWLIAGTALLTVLTVPGVR